MIRLSEYLAKILVSNGISQVFMLTGGGAMFLNDALGNQPGLKTVFCHHEQACAMAAEGYARVAGKPAVVNVTTGPGGINALNGVFGAWTDSIPMLVISGQVKRETCMATYKIPNLRQLGDQEADIIRMVQGITKYAVLVDDPKTIRYHVEKAIFLATSGRPGPCWLDIPVDVQSSMIDEESRAGFDPDQADAAEQVPNQLSKLCREVIQKIQKSSRPVILAGSGVRHAGADDLFDRVIHRLGIPVTTAWTHDIIASDDPLFCGRQGSIGDRAGNYAVQNADLLLVLGSRLCIRQISYNWQAFARKAYKIQVDIDQAELEKPTVKVDLPIVCDLRTFLRELDCQLDRILLDIFQHADWLAWCQERRKKYPVVRNDAQDVEEKGKINPYNFLDFLFRQLATDDVIVSGNATACVVAFQVAELQKGQRLFSNSGSASMGYDLPAAIGASVAHSGKRVICLAGDGSIQLNIQELQTIVHYQLPVKIFVLNNQGYVSIRQTQQNFFGRLTGESPASGITFPDMVRIASAYNIPACRLEDASYRTQLPGILSTPGPILCEVVLNPAQTFEPRLSSKQLPDGHIVSAPLEDMYPFLGKDELLENLLIPPIS